MGRGKEVGGHLRVVVLGLDMLPHGAKYSTEVGVMIDVFDTLGSITEVRTDRFARAMPGGEFVHSTAGSSGTLVCNGGLGILNNRLYHFPT
jgi:calcineurin-like phosphoesterase